jgi:protoheme IX farnesyltransferase
MTKPRITLMVLVTTVWGYCFGHAHPLSVVTDIKLWLLLLGVALGASGGAVLNQYMERDIDGAMARTRRRPLPAGHIRPIHALAFGLCLILLSEAILILGVNMLSAFLVLLTNFLYVLVYTPAKQVSSFNTTIGAVPGAMPPLIGWAGSHDSLGMGGWILFGILFVWQHPHVYAILWSHRGEYAKAGFKMLSNNDDGSRTGLAVVIGTIALLVVSVLPSLVGLSRWFYLLTSFSMGIWLLVLGIRMARLRSVESSRKLMKASVLYLPLLLVCMIIDSFL